IQDALQQGRGQFLEDELAPELEEVEVRDGGAPGFRTREVRNTQADLLRERLRVEVSPGRVEDPQIVRVQVRVQSAAKCRQAEEDGEGATILVAIDLADDRFEWHLEAEVSVDLGE